jgi:hypothetical protein
MLFTNLKWAGAGVIAATLLIMGWNVWGWYAAAGQLENAKAALRDETKRRIEAVAERNIAQADLDRARSALAQKELEATKSRVEGGVKVITKTIREHAKPDNSDCDIGEPVAGMLQRARAGNLPEATSGTPSN